jgi:NADH:ubiquinone oxidoreductase subunit E
MSCEIKFTLENDLVEFAKQCLLKEHPESYLIAVMHKVQNRYGFLSEIHLDEIAHLLQIPTANVYGVATFYHYFKLKPRGKFSISVCLGTACFVKGADSILSAFKSELGIDMGETSSDGLFSLECTRCIGVCALAPVVTINDKVFSNVTHNQVSQILNEVKKESTDNG